jgi:hypothetical protein
MNAARLFWITRGRAAAFGLGPYVAAALLFPGGTLIAALVWLYQHRKPATMRP